MKTIATFLTLISLSWSADPYILSGKYIYTMSGYLPKSRVNIETGAVEIYTNLVEFKVTDKMLRRVHKDLYSNMTYAEFISKTKEKYGALISIQEQSDSFRWTDHNEYTRIKELPAIKPIQLIN